MSNKATATLTSAKLFDVKGWTALVTGGGTGIGLMCAQALAANGAKVYITGRRKEALEAAAKSHQPTEGGGELIPITADINSKESIKALADELSKKEKWLNVLVNNAGIAGPTREIEKGQESMEGLQAELWKDEFSEWQDVFATNVTGHYFTSIAMMHLLHNATKSNYGISGSIINISSISGMINSSQHHIAYNASKAAAIQLTNLLAKELSAPAVKIRVNTIAPGVFPSEMTTKGESGQNQGESGDNQKSHIETEGYWEDKHIAAGRPGKEQDMAIAVLSLACNQYAVGATLKVDGGYTLGNP